MFLQEVNSLRKTEKKSSHVYNKLKFKSYVKLIQINFKNKKKYVDEIYLKKTIDHSYILMMKNLKEKLWKHSHLPLQQKE